MFSCTCISLLLNLRGINMLVCVSEPRTHACVRINIRVSMSKLFSPEILQERQVLARKSPRSPSSAYFSSSSLLLSSIPFFPLFPFITSFPISPPFPPTTSFLSIVSPFRFSSASSHPPPSLPHRSLIPSFYPPSLPCDSPSPHFSPSCSLYPALLFHSSPLFLLTPIRFLRPFKRPPREIRRCRLLITARGGAGSRGLE